MLQKNTTTIKVATMKEKNKIKNIYIYIRKKKEGRRVQWTWFSTIATKKDDHKSCHHEGKRKQKGKNKTKLVKEMIVLYNRNIIKQQDT